MSQQRQIEKPDISDWQSNILRITAFPSPAARIEGPSWWRDLVGDDPETRIAQPKTGVTQEAGPFQNGNLVLGIQQDRIDWIFKAAEDFNLLGPFIESLKQFIPLMSRWLEMAPPLQRLAFGPIIDLPVESREIGYHVLSTYLSSVQLDPEGSTDFTYQINRPRDSVSGIDGLRINRLSKWSVSLLQDTRLSVGPGQTGIMQLKQRFYCHLIMDINTAADFPDELPKEKLPQLLDELVGLSKDIAIEGDIP